MTREEAIELLDNLTGMVEDNQNSDYDTALRMGIKALKHSCPCDLCRYNPPSSGDGKPCSMCPACGGDE